MNVMREVDQSPLLLEKLVEHTLDQEGPTQISNRIDNRVKFFNRFRVLEDNATKQGEETETQLDGTERGLRDSNEEEFQRRL